MIWWRRGLVWGGWAIAVGSLGALATQLDRSPGRLVAAIQALTPHLVVVVVIAIIVGFFADRPMANANLFALFALLLFLGPLVATPSGPTLQPGSTPVRVAAVNILYVNRAADAAADDVAAVDADIVGFVEVTDPIGALLESHPSAAEYPYRVSLPGSGPGEGKVLWSKFPLVADADNDALRYVITATASTPDGPLRVVLVHTPAPFFNHAGWLRELARIPSIVAATDRPTVLMGDFNASYVHPPYRKMLASADLTDALPATDREFAMTWPMDWWFGPFVTLDHVLLTPDLSVVDAATFDVTGSDHRGVVATIGPASLKSAR